MLQGVAKHCRYAPSRNKVTAASAYFKFYFSEYRHALGSLGFLCRGSLGLACPPGKYGRAAESSNAFPLG
jgi:hypothetical protein